jgi:putative oxidoreductase
MFGRLGKHQDHAYALLRIVSGALFLCHGLQKIFGLLGGHKVDFPMQLWFGGVIELVAGALICLGLFTACAAFVASGTMAVAYVQFHWQGRFDQNFFPVVNHGEPAVVYCFLFLFFAARGSGPLSLDALRRKGK